MKLNKDNTKLMVTGQEAKMNIKVENTFKYLEAEIEGIRKQANELQTQITKTLKLNYTIAKPL